jgi:hypothetical protein
VYQNVILDRAPDVMDRELQDDGAAGRTGRTQHDIAAKVESPALHRGDQDSQAVRSRHSLLRLSDKATCKGWFRPL